MAKEKYQLLLWEEYVSQAPFLEDKQRKEWMKLGEKILGGDVTFLYELYREVQTQEDLHKAEIRTLLETMIGIFEEVLPLGSVVDLRKEYLKGTIPSEDVERVRVVIVKRYVEESPEGFYYPYAGTIYPTGIPGTETLLLFTPAMIEQVVSRGYSDEQEEAYLYLMKREFFLERKLRSIGFGNKEEWEQYYRYRKGGQSA